MKTVMSKWRFFGVAMSLWVACAVHAQDAPKYSNEFLAVGVGARALGMGNAYTSVVNDVTSGYWNPAGILGVQGDLQVGLMHSEYFAGIAKYDYIGLAKPIDSSPATMRNSVLLAQPDGPTNTMNSPSRTVRSTP